MHSSKPKGTQATLVKLSVSQNQTKKMWQRGQRGRGKMAGERGRKERARVRLIRTHCSFRYVEEIVKEQ